MSIHQFVAKGKHTLPVLGMKLWPDDEGFQPRDMSWGYVVNPDGNKEHVQHGDWIEVDAMGVHAHVIRGHHE